MMHKTAICIRTMLMRNTKCNLAVIGESRASRFFLLSNETHGRKLLRQKSAPSSHLHTLTHSFTHEDSISPAALSNSLSTVVPANGTFAPWTSGLHT